MTFGFCACKIIVAQQNTAACKKPVWWAYTCTLHCSEGGERPKISVHSYQLNCIVTTAEKSHQGQA